MVIGFDVHLLVFHCFLVQKGITTYDWIYYKEELKAMEKTLSEGDIAPETFREWKAKYWERELRDRRKKSKVIESAQPIEKEGSHT